MFIGIDLGGTKTHVVAEERGEVIFDVSVPTPSWQSGTLLEDAANPRHLLGVFDHLPGATSASIVIGAHGLDSVRQVEDFSTRVSRVHGGPVLAVNDVELIAPAAGVETAIAVIAGTGSKVVGHNLVGESISAGGHGHILGDPGSAPGLAREAVRAVLDAGDRGEEPDVLAVNLMARFGVHDVIALGYAFAAAIGLESWGMLGPLIFASADAGSRIATAVIDDAARLLARDVAMIRHRGAVGMDVVCAGGVITNQPRLYHALARHIDDLELGLTVSMLTVPPVMGAIALARKLPNQPIKVSNGGSQ